MNPVLKTIQERSSIRRYKDTPLTEEELFLLKDAVLAAPTARNLQGLRYYFITDQSIIKKINERVIHHSSDAVRARQKERGSVSFFFDAPLVVIITAGDQMWPDMDAGIAVGILSIAAQSMGLGNVILGIPALAFQEDDPENCGQLLGFEEGEKYRIAIAIGHPDTEKAPHKKNFDLIKDF
jgi:nitroreductase